MEGALIIQGVSIDKFLECVSDVIQQKVNEAVRTIKAEELQEKFLSPAEVQKLFIPNISRQTLVNYTKQGLLKKHILGRSTWYKYSEVLEAVHNIKRYKPS